jgi:hypothetical protein
MTIRKKIFYHNFNLKHNMQLYAKMKVHILLKCHSTNRTLEIQLLISA